MSGSCGCSNPSLLILSVSIILLSISIAFLSLSINSLRKRSNAEFAGRSSDTLKKDDYWCNPMEEDEKRQSGSSRKTSTSVGPLEGDEEPKNITPDSSVSQKSDPSSHPLASEKEDRRSETLSNWNRESGPGRSRKHDGGQEDAPSGNRISMEDVASSNSINNEGSYAGAPPISVVRKKDDTAGDGPKSSRQHKITSSGGSASKKYSPPVNKSTRGGGGREWWCGNCNNGPMNIETDRQTLHQLHE